MNSRDIDMGARMRIESLQYFLEIARTGSFTLAAQRLFVSQQGLSKSVKALERELGCSLFERGGKRVRLTEAGRALAPLAKRCVDAHRLLQEEMARFASTRRDEAPARVVVMSFIANELFTLMSRDLERYGLREVALVERTLPEILTAFEREDAGPCGEAALVAVSNARLPELRTHEGLVFEPLASATIMVSGSTSLISPRKRALSIPEIARLPVAHYTDAVLESLLDEAFCAHPFQNVVLRTSSTQLINDYVTQGRAVTFFDTLGAFLSSRIGEAAEEAPAHDAGSDAEEGPSLPSYLGEATQTGNVLLLPIKGAPLFSVGFLTSSAAPPDTATSAYLSRFAACLREVCAPYLAKFPVATRATPQ